MHENNVEHEMAAVNIASSDPIMAQAKEGRDLVKLQDEIRDSVDSVKAVRHALGETQPKDVTQLFGTVIDRQLSRVGIRSFGDENEVAGVESLGLGLTPARYLETRIDACESFLSEFANWTKSITKRFLSDIVEQLAALREDHDSLAKVSKLLLEQCRNDDTTFVKGPISLNMSQRVLIMNGKIPADLVNQLTRFAATTRAITTNFYRTNQANTNEIISYFGGFAGLTAIEAMDRLLRLPQAVSKYQFKEAMFVLREESNNQWETRGSVELLGERRYVNSYLLDRTPRADINDLMDWLDLYRKHECIKIEKKQPKDAPLEMKALTKAEVEKAILAVGTTLNDVEQLFKQGDKYLIDGNEYKKMLAMLNASDWGEDVKGHVANAYTSLILSRNNEQIQLRSQMVKYTTLVMHAILGVCESSME